MPLINLDSLINQANQQASAESILTQTMSRAFVEELMSMETSSYILAIKYFASILCGCFLIINMINIYFSPSHQNIGENIKKPGKMMNEIAGQIFLVLTVSILPHIFVGLEIVMDKISSVIQSKNKAISITLYESFVQFARIAALDKATEVAKEAGDIEVLGFNFKGVVGATSSIAAPNKYVYTFSVINIPLAFFNYSMAMAMYLERFLMLFVMKAMAPLVIATYMYSKEKEIQRTIFKFFKILVALFLILPFGLIIFNIIDGVFLKLCTASGIIDQATTGANDTTSILGDIAGATIDTILNITGYSVFLFTPLLLLSIILKFSFITKTTNLIWKILL